MTVLGSEGSFRSGGPQPPLPSETAQTAAQTLPAKALLIAQDTINDPQAMYQMLNTKENDRSGHYQSQAGKPVLPMMAQLRMDPLAEPKVDDSNEKFDQLFEKLPQDAKARLQEENKRPFDQRNPLYTGLANLMKMAAKTLALAQQIGNPVIPGTPEAEKYENFAALPYLSMLGASKMNEEMMNALKDLLGELGHNFVDYDPLNDALNDLMEMLKNFSDISGRAIRGKATAEDTEKLKNLAANMEEKIKVLQGKDQGGASTLFLPYLKATRLIARAFSIPVAVAPQLILSLGIAQIGADKEAGVEMGGSLNEVVEQGLIENLGGHSFIVNTLVKALLPTLGVVSALLSKYGLGPTPVKKEKEVEASRFFDLQITAHMVMKTGLFDVITQAIAEAINIPEKKRPRFKALMLFGIISALALTGGGTNNDKQSQMISTLEGYFTPQLQLLLQEHDEEGKSAEGDEKALALKALLRQSSAALEQGNFQDIVALGWTGMGLMGGSKEKVEKDLESFRTNALNFAAAVQGGIMENNQRIPEVTVAV